MQNSHFNKYVHFCSFAEIIIPRRSARSLMMTMTMTTQLAGIVALSGPVVLLGMLNGRVWKSVLETVNRFLALVKLLVEWESTLTATTAVTKTILTVQYQSESQNVNFYGICTANIPVSGYW